MIKLLVSIYTDAPDTVIRPVTEMLLGIYERGIQVDIITNPDTFYNQKFRDCGMNVFEFLPKGKFDRATIKRLKQMLKEGEYDVFQSFHNRWMAISNWATRGVDVINVGYRGAVFNSIDPSYLLTINNPNLDYLLCVTRSIEQNAKKNLFFKKPKPVHVYKGQDLSWFNTSTEVFDRSKLGIPHDAFIAITLANVRPIKGVDYFINSMNHIPNDVPIHILCVGHHTDSEEFQELKKNSKHSEHIHLLGFHDDVTTFLRSSDLYVLPTIGEEGISRAAMEAMSLGLPVLTTKCGGPEELVEDGVSGKHIAKKDTKAIADGMMYFFENADVCKAMGEQAKMRIKTQFSMESYIENMYQFYTEIVATKNKAN